jgi:hypothetical protein
MSVCPNSMPPTAVGVSGPTTLLAIRKAIDGFVDQCKIAISHAKRQNLASFKWEMVRNPISRSFAERFTEWERELNNRPLALDEPYESRLTFIREFYMEYLLHTWKACITSADASESLLTLLKLELDAPKHEKDGSIDLTKYADYIFSQTTAFFERVGGPWCKAEHRCHMAQWLLGGDDEDSFFANTLESYVDSDINNYEDRMEESRGYANIIEDKLRQLCSLD